MREEGRIEGGWEDGGDFVGGFGDVFVLEIMDLLLGWFFVFEGCWGVFVGYFDGGG